MRGLASFLIAAVLCAAPTGLAAPTGAAQPPAELVLPLTGEPDVRFPGAIEPDSLPEICARVARSHRAHAVRSEGLVRCRWRPTRHEGLRVLEVESPAARTLLVGSVVEPGRVRFLASLGAELGGTDRWEARVERVRRADGLLLVHLRERYAAGFRGAPRQEIRHVLVCRADGEGAPSACPVRVPVATSSGDRLRARASMTTSPSQVRLRMSTGTLRALFRERGPVRFTRDPWGAPIDLDASGPSLTLPL